MFHSLYQDFQNPTLARDLKGLLLLKLALGATVYLFLTISGLEYPFNFHDFADLYRTCNSININIGFAQFVCMVNVQSITQPLPILLSFMLMFISFGLIYSAFFNYLSRKGQLFLMLLLLIHPYLLISTFRLTTDLFAMLAVSITVYFIVRNLEFKLSFYLIILTLISFRYHLVAIFLPLFLLTLYENLRYKNRIDYLNLISILLILTGLYLSISYALMFTGHNSGFDPVSLMFNIIYLLGFREMVAIDGIAAFLCCNLAWHNLQFAISIGLIILHAIGLAGLWKVSKDINNKILVTLLYLIPCILVIGHLRFLLALMPVIMAGTAYLFLSNKSITSFTDSNDRPI
jgi:hypothetical protein